MVDGSGGSHEDDKAMATLVDGSGLESWAKL